MFLKVVGVLMMLDGVMSALAAMPKLNSFIYRNFADQSLIVAHMLLAGLLLLAGRQTLQGLWRQFSAAVVVAALIVAGFEVTRFDWPAFVMRAVYTAGVLVLLIRARANSRSLN